MNKRPTQLNRASNLYKFQLKLSGGGPFGTAPATLKSPRPVLAVRVAEDDEFRGKPFNLLREKGLKRSKITPTIARKHGLPHTG